MNRVSAPGGPPIDRLQIDHLQVLFQSSSIIASCPWIPILAQSWLRRVSLSLFNLGLQVRLPGSLNLDLQLYLQTCSITASKCTSQFPQSQSPIASPDSLDHGLRVYLWVNSIVIFRHTLNYSQTPPAAIPDILWIDELLYIYIETEMRIPTELMSFKNRSTISSCYAFLAHQQPSQRRCFFPRLFNCGSRCSQTCRWCSPVLPGLLSALPVTLHAGRNALLGSDTLLKLTHLSLHSIASQTLLEATGD